jgi:hypothetical protein
MKNLFAQWKLNVTRSQTRFDGLALEQVETPLSDAGGFWNADTFTIGNAVSRFT